jgi:hypothetical protein
VRAAGRTWCARRGQLRTHVRTHPGALRVQPQQAGALDCQQLQHIAVIKRRRLLLLLLLLLLLQVC